MKSDILFFNTKLCSGCGLCEMACSLTNKGECSRENSLIRVSAHPYLSVPMVSHSIDCCCPDGNEKCVEICNQKALIFVSRDAATLKMTEEGNWLPCPMF